MQPLPDNIDFEKTYRLKGSTLAELLRSHNAVANFDIGPGLGGSVSEDGISIYLAAAAAGGGGTAWAAEITGISNDTLTVKRVQADGTVVDPEVLVAKPWKLRHHTSSPGDHYPGITSLTTISADVVEVSDGTATETWHVAPAYTVGDLVLVVPVAYSGLDDGGDPAAPIVWQDVNDDARRWAVEDYID